jgi:chorismate mutase
MENIVKKEINEMVLSLLVDLESQNNLDPSTEIEILEIIQELELQHVFTPDIQRRINDYKHNSLGLTECGDGSEI